MVSIHMKYRQIMGIVFFAIVIGFTCSHALPAQTQNTDAPRVLLYHSFDNGLENVDRSAGPVTVTLGKGVTVRDRGIYGKAAGLDGGAVDATVKMLMDTPAPATGWTIAFWQHLDEKDVLTAPDFDLLTVLDQQGERLLTMNKSGLVELTAGDQSTKMDCFDALYWISEEDIHLTVTYDADGAGGASPRGKLTVYFEARPYGCVYVDLGDRRPTTIVLGGDDVSSAADELYVFDAPLPLRAIHHLSRPPRKDIGTMEDWLAGISRTEALRTMAVRRAAWRKLARQGQVIEAEGGATDGVTDGEQAYSASSRKYISVGGKLLKITFDVAEAGDYALAVRYILDRQIDTMWPVRNADAKTGWTHNYATVKTVLDGKDLGATKLYPTGTYTGHRGDVDPWAWKNLGGGKKVRLTAGTHTLEIQKTAGIASPSYDAVLVATDAGPEVQHPRWADQYRTPPAWWVADRKTSTRGGKRTDTYTVALRNRCDEPYACTIALEHDMLGKSQKASTETRLIELGPHEEKTFEITFNTPTRVKGSSGYLRVVLWNEDVSLPMEYRLWNLIPVAGFAERQHPTLVPVPDPQMQEKFKAWLETRNPKPLTQELKAWAAGPDASKCALEYRALRGGAKAGIRLFVNALLDEQLEMLDMWMSMSAADLEVYLPDAHAQDSGYGMCWDKVANKLTGVWHGKTFDYRTKPDMGDVWKNGGDIDLVTEMTAKGIQYRTLKDGKEIINEGTWKREEYPTVFMALRQIRWGAFLAVNYSSTVATYPKRAGLPILAEAYYLTGDEKYARKAVEFARVLARKYTMLTNQHFGGLHREDRDWWGGRIGRYYQSEYGYGLWQLMGTRLLDLMWTALSEDERDMIEHNFVRWGMFDATWGPLWDDPDKYAKVNREDPPPFIPFARVAGDPAPYDGLQDYLRLVNRMVFPDGIHICGVGGYGGVNAYIGYMQKLAALGLDVTKDNPSLRQSFLSHPRFIFSCGGLPPMGDGGGGQYVLGLYPSYGCPTKQQYEWGYELYGDELFKVMPDFIAAVSKNCNSGTGTERAAKMREFYSRSDFPFKKIWPTMFIAEDKGLAMLRNRVAKEPIDWVEVVFDYGRYGGRCHGQPTKLSTVTSFNGQMASSDWGDLTRNAPEGNNGWFKGGYSHNTVQVDFRGHRGSAGPVVVGKLRESGGDEQIQWIDADSEKMFDGIYARRTVFTTPFGVVDLYLCRSDKEHTYDWGYHCWGIAGTDLKLTPTDLSDQGLLRFARHFRSAKADGLVQVTWKNQPMTKPPRKASTSMIGENTYVRLWALPAKGTEVILLAGPAVTSLCEEKEVDYTLLRRKTASTVFATVQEPWREATGPRVKSVRALPVKSGGKPVTGIEGYALEITLTDGNRKVFFVNYSGGEKTVGAVTTKANVAAWDD